MRNEEDIEMQSEGLLSDKVKIINDDVNADDFERGKYKILKNISRNEILSKIKVDPYLHSHYKKNSIKKQQKIVDVFMREPTQADQPGYIYGFKHFQEHSKNPHHESYDIKIGKTIYQRPCSRISQWQAVDNEKYVVIFIIRTEHSNKLERLVHAFFDYTRITNKVINEKKRTEWFKFDKGQNTQSIIVQKVNKLMIEIQSHGSEKQNRSLSKAQIQRKDQLSKFLEQLNLDQFSRQSNLIILTGNKGAGKTSLKQLLSNGSLISKKVESQSQQFYYSTIQQGNQYFNFKNPRLSKDQIPTKNSHHISNKIVKIQNFSQCQIKRLHQKQAQALFQIVRSSYYEWYRIYNCSYFVFPILLIKQSDIVTTSWPEEGIRRLESILKDYLRSFTFNKKVSSPQGQNLLFLEEEQVKKMQFPKLSIIITHSTPQKYKTSPKNKMFKFYFDNNKASFQSQQLFQVFDNSRIEFFQKPAFQGQYRSDMVASIKKSLLQQSSHESLISQKQFSYEYHQKQFLLNDNFELLLVELVRIVSKSINPFFKYLLDKRLKSCQQNYCGQKSLYSSYPSVRSVSNNHFQNKINELDLMISKSKILKSLQQTILRLKSSSSQKQIFLQTEKLLQLINTSSESNDSEKKLSTLCFFNIFCECMLKSISIKQSGRSQMHFSQSIAQNSIEYLTDIKMFEFLFDKIEQCKVQQIQNICNEFIQKQLFSSMSTTLHIIYNDVYQRVVQIEHNTSDSQKLEPIYSDLNRLYEFTLLIDEKKCQKKNEGKPENYEMEFDGSESDNEDNYKMKDDNDLNLAYKFFKQLYCQIVKKSPRNLITTSYKKQLIQLIEILKKIKILEDTCRVSFIIVFSRLKKMIEDVLFQNGKNLNKFKTINQKKKHIKKWNYRQKIYINNAKKRAKPKLQKSNKQPTIFPLKQSFTQQYNQNLTPGETGQYQQLDSSDFQDNLKRALKASLELFEKKKLKEQVIQVSDDDEDSGEQYDQEDYINDLEVNGDDNDQNSNQNQDQVGKKQKNGYRLRKRHLQTREQNQNFDKQNQFQEQDISMIMGKEDQDFFQRQKINIQEQIQAMRRIERQNMKNKHRRNKLWPNENAKNQCLKQNEVKKTIVID